MDSVVALERELLDPACRVDSDRVATLLAPDGTFVRHAGEGRPPVTDGPFAESKDLIAGWMIIDVDSWERALERAAQLSAAPGAGGQPICEWIEVRPFMSEPPSHDELAAL